MLGKKTQAIKQSGGFTLIELLVVIAIIGLLASIILASLNTARQKGRDARRVADVKEIQLALELYYDSSSQYPTTIAGSVLAPSYISVLPTDPSTSATYPYAALQGAALTAATCGAYHLGANLEVNDPTTLGGDADGIPNPAANTYGTAAPGGGTYDGPVCNSGGTDFIGTDTGSCAATQVAGTFCYDVKP